MSDELLFVVPSESSVLGFFGRGPYPIPFPGNISPTKKPDYNMLVLYQIMRGMNLNYSFKRMVKMMHDLDKVEDVVRGFIDVQSSKPKESGYLNLAEAFSGLNNLKFDYVPTDFGHKLRIWGADNEEWTFDIRRGGHRIRKDYNRDYSKLLGVRKVDMLTFKKLSKERSDLIEPLSKKMKRE